MLRLGLRGDVGSSTINDGNADRVRLVVGDDRGAGTGGAGVELSEVRITLTARTAWIGRRGDTNPVRVAEALRRPGRNSGPRDVEVFAPERWLDDRTADVCAALDAPRVTGDMAPEEVDAASQPRCGRWPQTRTVHAESRRCSTCGARNWSRSALPGVDGEGACDDPAVPNHCERPGGCDGTKLGPSERGTEEGARVAARAGQGRGPAAEGLCRVR